MRMHHCAALMPQNNKPTDMSRIEAKSASIIGPVVSSESTRLLRSAQHPNSRLDQRGSTSLGFRTPPLRRVWSSTETTWIRYEPPRFLPIAIAMATGPSRPAPQTTAHVTCDASVEH